MLCLHHRGAHVNIFVIFRHSWRKVSEKRNSDFSVSWTAIYCVINCVKLTLTNTNGNDVRLLKFRGLT